MDPVKAQKFWRLVEENYLSNDPESLLSSMARNMEFLQAKTRQTAGMQDWYMSLAQAIRDRVMERWNDTQQAYYRENAKRVYYLSLEFLMGKSIENALINLDMLKSSQEALGEIGNNLQALIDTEPDPGLGNGGLGRLAACFLDSMATLQLPAYGYGLRYDYGIFEQAIIDGFQRERPDNWLRNGYAWEITRPEYTNMVHFGGYVRPWTDESGHLRFSWEGTEKIVAQAYDTPIPGYRNDTINTLRLWSAKATQEFDLPKFNRGEYVHSVEDRILSENITRVLYPKDDIPPGRELRLKQEYFFVAATLHDIVRRFKVNNDSFDVFPDKVAIQLNDTHPAIAIAELMRLLVDGEHLEWERAWDICLGTFGYTNHTIMPEALERWPVELLERLLPRHLQIIYEINQRFLDLVRQRFPGDNERLGRMSIIEEQPTKAVNMAHLAIVGSHSVNGVAELHTSIIETSLFADFYQLWPKKFNNKTNGITQRRWLKLSNPRLSRLVTERIGGGWVTDLFEMKKLAPLADKPDFRAQWSQIKRENKEDLAEYVKGHYGLDLNLDSIFDIQVKRIHEYKRQLMMALYIITLYNRIKADPSMTMVPRTFIFGGKAAPGYAIAKMIIKLITSVARRVNGDPDVGDRLRVVFLANYGVSLAENIFPAADLSEQISTAGYEASGTGNMKFMLNGALTIGTLDGANVEILQEVGDDNIFIFGLRVEEVKALRRAGYRPWEYVAVDQELRGVLDLMASGTLSPEQPDLFRPLIDSLLGMDQFMVLADYRAYVDCQERVSQAYLDHESWTRMSILNAAHVGKFSSDRTIAEYAREIWDVQAVKPLMKRDRNHI